MGIPTPEAAIMSPPVPEAIPAALTPGTTVPMSHPGAPMPSTSAAGASMTAPAVPEAIPAAMVPGATIPISRPETPMPSASGPGAAITAPPVPEAVAAAMVPGTAVPVSRPGTDSIPLLLPGAAAAEPLPGAIALPPIIEGIDGGLPRILDGAVTMPLAPAATAPGYYFLTPASAPGSATAPAFRRRTFEVRDIRRDFPILSERVHGRRLIWLDNAATTHKPRAVIERLVHYYEHEYSNVHRGAHELAARSTNAYEGAREKLQHFLGASSASEIVFVRGTTEAINLVAGSWGRRFVEKGDEILLTTIEHHSNIVPWQLLAETVGATIRVVPVTDRGEVLLDDYAKLLNSHTRLVALTHVSNALGTILPICEMVQMAHRHDARVLVDGAQAVSHFPVNVQDLDADFYALSGHKMFGPSGVGVLYAKRSILDEMPPWQGGGNMIQRVTFEKSTYADPPGRFEAGTATLGPAVGLGAAVDYLQSIGMENVARHEHELLAHATAVLSQIPGLRLIGTAPNKAAVLSFIVNGIEAEEIGKMLDREGIAVRAGHHCAQPTMDRFGVVSTVRPSLALYNTHDEIDELARCLRKAVVHGRGNLR
ncbi:MAG: SufS family cysteine desulfurase [Deltaproteobacteria bacterium]|nr:SufS family cysteine desulfurase [Deltaproteobacteria bacterium]